MLIEPRLRLAEPGELVREQLATPLKVVKSGEDPAVLQGIRIALGYHEPDEHKECVAVERQRSTAGGFSRAGVSPPSVLHFKGFNGDGYHRRRACQLQQLVLRQATLRTTSGYQKIIYVRISGPSRNKWPCGSRP